MQNREISKDAPSISMRESFIENFFLRAHAQRPQTQTIMIRAVLHTDDAVVPQSLLSSSITPELGTTARTLEPTTGCCRKSNEILSLSLARSLARSGLYLFETPDPPPRPRASRASCSGVGGSGITCRVDLSIRIQGLGSRVQGLGCRIEGLDLSLSAIPELKLDV